MAMVAAVTATPGPVAPVPFLTNRLGAEAGVGASVMGPAADGEKASATANYLSIAFSYNPDANRLVMLYRDRVTGDTISQIPSEVALKYEAFSRHHPDDKKHAALSNSVGLNGKVDNADNGLKTNGAPSIESGDASGARSESGGSGNFHDQTGAAVAVATTAARFNIVV
ncbi:putative S-type pyocin [Azospirillaceae bacterium]